MAQKGLGAAKVAVEEAQKNAGPVEFPRFTLKADEGPKQVRFLSPENALTFMQHWTEYQNGWKRNYVCPNEEIGDDNCITCRGKKGVDFVSDSRKHAHMIELINRTTGQVEVWTFSPMAMSVLLEMNDQIGTLSDRDFKIEFKENTDENIKAKFIYTIEPVTDGPTALSKADKELKRYNLEDLVSKYNEDNLKNIAAMKPGETGKKAASPKDVSNDFLAAALGTKKNLKDEFASLTKSKPTPAAEPKASEETTVSGDETEEFMKLLNNM